MKRALAVAAVAAVAAALAAAAAAAGPPTLHFRVFARTGIKLTDVLWTGSHFVYVENTENALWAAPPRGLPLSRLARMPKVTEETRCAPAPAGHGFVAGALYCHAPDNKIYRIGADGKDVTAIATLPETATADGALDFDTVGGFGYRLVVATGRSGNPKPPGGTVYTVDPTGKVAKVGSYAGPGGADEVLVAPAGFGSAAGEALLTVDPGKGGGAVVAMGAKGRTRTLARLDDGPNPIAAIPTTPRAAGPAAAGLYVTDTLSTNVYLLPAAQLARYAGDVIVGSELQAHFWVLSPRGKGFTALRLPTNLRGGKYNLEGARFVG